MVKNVLIVDDEVQICSLLESLFKKKGFGVITALSGEAAKDIIDQLPPFYAVITDMHMGKISGNDVAKVVKRKNPDTICILCFSSFKVDPLPGLYNEIFYKPIDFGNLFRALNC